MLCYSGRETRRRIRHVDLVSRCFPFSTDFPCPVPARRSCRSPTRRGAGKDLLDEEENVERRRWEALSTKEKISDWAMTHQYSLIVGSWAASLGLAAAIIMKDRHQTTSQKVREALVLSPLRKVLTGLLAVVGCSSPYVGTGIDHRRPHRCWHPDTPGS